MVNPTSHPKLKLRSVASWIPIMMMLSLGLHGIVLFLPIASSDEEPIPPPNPEGESITVTRLPTNSGASSGSKPDADADGNGASRRPATSANSQTTATTPNAASRTQTGRTQTHRSQGRTGQDSSSERSTSDRAASTTTRTQGSSGQTQPQTSPSTASSSVPNLGTPSTGTPSTTATPQVSQALRDRIAELELNYRYDPWRTTPQEALDVFQTWTTTVQEKTGIPFFFPQRVRDPLTVDYPLRVCLPIEPAAASLGVLTDANGAIVGDPEIIRSTGYEGFNAAAIAQVKAQSFPQNTKFKAYTFEVQVKYDATHCLGNASIAN